MYKQKKYSSKPKIYCINIVRLLTSLVRCKVYLSEGQIKNKYVKEIAIRERLVGRCYPGFLCDYKACVLE